MFALWAVVVFISSLLYPIIANKLDSHFEQKFGIELDIIYSSLISIAMALIFSVLATIGLDLIIKDDPIFKYIYFWLIGLGFFFPVIVFHRTDGRKKKD